MTYEFDPSLKKYENPRDAVKHQLRIDKAEGEVAVHMVLSPLDFSIDHDAMTVWKAFKDFTLWQDDMRYNNVIGDQPEGGETYLTIRPKYHAHFNETYASLPDFDASYTKTLIVRKAIPGQLLAFEALSPDGHNIESYYIFSLGERAGATAVSAFFSYAPVWGHKENEQDLWASYQHFCEEIEERWKKAYIPRLRQVLSSHR